jgi:hypothetical protein
MKFKNYIETESGIKDTSTSPGAAGQVLSSTVTGTSWIDQDTLVSAASKLVVISCKNTSGSTINKGTPVYQTGTVGATDVIEVAPADATISTGSLPAIGILQTTLINNNDPVTDPGNVVITGEFLNYSTANIPTNNPGGVPITGDTVYLAPGGGLTCIKPIGAGNAIQNLGLIGKVSGGNAGSITVSSIMRANDVPNLPTGRIWIGDGNTIVSDTVYVDEPNGRVGIGTILPQAELHVSGGNIRIDDTEQLQFGAGGVRINNDSAGRMYLRAPLAYYFEGNGGYRMMLDGNSGNLGIGTTSPVAKLEVVGESGVIIDSGSSASANLTLIGDGSSFGGGGKIDVIGGSSDFASYFLNVKRSPNTLEAVNQYWMLDSGWKWDGNIGATRAQPYTSYDFKSQGSSQMVIYNNNVGIGTTSPDSKLEVASTDSNTYVHIRNDSTGSTRLKLSNATDNNANGFQIINNSLNGQVNLLNYKATTLALWTNGSQKLTILSGGNVGIGANNPLAKLQVDGNANIGLLHTNFAGASFNVNLGFENYNNGFAAIATGQNTLADASQSFSMGFQSKATGTASLAGGNVNPITALPSESAGQASIAFGNGVKTNSNANYSQAFGRGTQTGGGLTSANQAMAMGYFSIAFGDNSFSGGNNSRAFGEASFAFGEGAVGSKGDGNIALGIGVTTPNDGANAYSSGQVAVGNYNVWGTGQPLSFSVGNGFSDSQRLTALCVNRNTGNTGMGNVFNPQSKLQVNGGIQLANDVAAPSAAKVGTFKYYTSGNNSYVDMCMQTGASTYAWVNIVTNSW